MYVRRTRQKVTGGWVEHTPKSGNRRIVPIPRDLARSLTAYVQNHPRGDEPDSPFWPGRSLVHDPKGNRAVIDYDQPWNPAVFYKAVYKPTVQATEGIPDALRQHDLRHSFASICAANNIPAARVAGGMGHSNEIVTRTICTHLFAEDATRDEDALDAAFVGGVGAKVIAFPKQA